MELKKIELQKRKSFQDFTSLFFALAIIFGVAIFFIILSYMYGQMQPKLNTALTDATGGSDPNSNVTTILDQTDNSIGRFNILFPFLLIGVFGFVLVTALMGQSHPAFLFIGLIVLGVALILAAVYSNVYEELTDNANLVDTEAEFNIMGLFLDNLPIIILILFVAIGAILYMRAGGASQGM